jgi:pyruvate kinase
VRLALSPGDSSKIEQGEILVIQDTTAEDLDAIRHAAGVVTESPAERSHAAVIAQRLGIPIISGVPNATRDLRHGEVVTLQIRDGLVHRGTGVNTAARLDTML